MSSSLTDSSPRASYSGLTAFTPARFDRLGRTAFVSQPKGGGTISVSVAAGERSGRRTDGPAIVAEGLTKSFGDVRALAGIDFRAPAGTVLGLLGPNGAGKT